MESRRFDDKTKDPTMGTKLLAELPGILTWAVQGCLLWQREGLERPEIVRAATAEYRSENDKLGAFLAECCEIDPHASAITQFLYDAYTEWCRKSGEEPKTKTMLGILLKERGFEPDKVTGLRAWIGLRLL